MLESHERIWDAVHGTDTVVFGAPVPAADYLTEIKALTVLLLHLATQPGGEELASWAQNARLDRDRSASGRGARRGLAPPADLRLRGQAIAATDAVLRQPDLDTAADALHPWTELTPQTNDGELGWLADHTTMTALLTRLVMAATAQRRRLSTLLADQAPIDARFIPQALLPPCTPAISVGCSRSPPPRVVSSPVCAWPSSAGPAAPGSTQPPSSASTREPASMRYAPAPARSPADPAPSSTTSSVLPPSGPRRPSTTALEKQQSAPSPTRLAGTKHGHAATAPEPWAAAGATPSPGSGRSMPTAPRHSAPAGPGAPPPARWPTTAATPSASTPAPRPVRHSTL